MNVGFRPRLKARPSLYDLVRNRNIDRLSLRPTTPTTSFELPPLPISPKTPSSSVPPTSTQEKQKDTTQETNSMGPKKAAAQDIDGEEQYGKLGTQILSIS